MIRQILVLMLLCATHARSQQLPGGLGRPLQQAQGTVSFTFVASNRGIPLSSLGSQAQLQFGSVSYAGMGRRQGLEIAAGTTSFLVRTWLALRLDNPAQPGGSAELSAMLLSPDPDHTYSIDGVRLSTASQRIQAHVSYGSVTEHRLEIEIPRSVPESRAGVTQAITFLAVPN